MRYKETNTRDVSWKEEFVALVKRRGGEIANEIVREINLKMENEEE
jgi:hypothetical protein